MNTAIHPARRAPLLLLACVVVPALAPAQHPVARRAITHEDVWLMKRFGAPALSPDGRWVVFTVTEPAYNPAEQSTDLWITAVDGATPPRRLTATKGGEGGVAWSPDGRRIAFTAQREGDDAAQVYLLDVAPELRSVIDGILAAYQITPPESVRGLRRLAMACPALPTCGLAVAEAERALPGVLDELQALFDDVGLGDETPTIRMTGCPNGCARPYVAEIGLVGDAVDRYQVWLGGDTAGTRLATAVADRVHKTDLPALLRPLLERYRDERLPGEALGDFLTRAQITSVEYTPSVPLRVAREEVPA